MGKILEMLRRNLFSCFGICASKEDAEPVEVEGEVLVLDNPSLSVDGNTVHRTPSDRHFRPVARLEDPELVMMESFMEAIRRKRFQRVKEQFDRFEKSSSKWWQLFYASESANCCPCKAHSGLLTRCDSLPERLDECGRFSSSFAGSSFSRSETSLLRQRDDIFGYNADPGDCALKRWHKFKNKDERVQLRLRWFVELNN